MGLGVLPARTSMELYLKFEGNSNDSSGNGRNCTDIAMAYGLSYGKFGQGARFAGGSSKLTLVGVPGTSTTYTISMWINPLPGSATYANLFANTAAGLFLKSGRINLYYSGDHLGATTLTSGVWYHVCVSVSAGAGTIYLNGKIDATLTGVTAFTATNIGNDAAGQKYVGDVDELIFEKVAWNYSRVKKYYSQAKGRFVAQ